MRARLGIAAGLIASLSLLGACQKEPDVEAYADATPPPQIETTEVAPLAGAPSADAEGAVTQASNDTYMASLAAKGLLAERRINPDTGETVLVVYNHPIQNPVLRGGPRYRYAANHHRARSGSMNRGWASNAGRAQAGSAEAASSAASSASASTSNAASAAAAQPAAPAADAAPVEQAAVSAPSGPGVQPITQAAEPAVNVTDPARAGFEMTPMMWGIVGLIILALLIALFVANRPKPRRHSYSSHQAPPEASGGDHNGEAHA